MTARTGKFKHCFQLAPVVQTLDNPIHWIKTLNLIAADSVTHFSEPVWPALSSMLTDMISDYFISIFVTSCKKYINK